ncbi:MAG: hypothetical protein DMG07_26880 [Acidobacteria bacterium]|nr:MAG: hypothetical protein DMG07_26880 [Acidobacteriota bacterium]
MEADVLRKLALHEIQGACARFVAKVGDEEQTEAFAAALCDWLAAWFEGFLNPPAPPEAAEQARAWDEALRCARRDLELRRDELAAE